MPVPGWLVVGGEAPDLGRVQMPYRPTEADEGFGQAEFGLYNKVVTGSVEPWRAMKGAGSRRRVAQLRSTRPPATWEGTRAQPTLHEAAVAALWPPHLSGP